MGLGKRYTALQGWETVSPAGLGESIDSPVGLGDREPCRARGKYRQPCGAGRQRALQG